MFIYAGKRFSSSVTLSRAADVVCEKCSCAYRYQLVRRGTASASAPYYVGQASAKERAAKSSQKAALKKLKAGVEPVACPDCGWFQADMVREIRRRTARWLIWVAVFVPVILAIVMLIDWSVATHQFRWDF